MKTKIKRVSKRTLAVLLGVLMIVSTLVVGQMITANAAGINLDDCTYVGLNFENGSNGTVNGVSADQYRVNFTKDSNNSDHWYSGYIYVNTTSSGWNFYTKWVLNWGSGDTWWAGENTMSTCGSNIYPIVYENGSSDTLQAPSCSSGYVRLQFDAYNDTGESGDGRYLGVKINKSDVSALTFNSLTADKSTLTAGETTTLTPSVSNGSQSYNYTYSVKNKSTNATVSCMSDSTFTAPSVEETTVYTVTCTVSDNNCPGLATQTKTCDITVNPPNVIYVDNQSENSTIYLYTYNDAVTGAWPGWKIIDNNAAAALSQATGVTITKLDNGIYKIVGIQLADNAIFNIGNGSWQTGNDAAGGIVNKRLYTLKSDKSIVKEDNYTEGPSYYVTGDKGLTGASQNWGQTPSEGLMSLSSGTTYTKTFSGIAAGSYEFRISSNTGLTEGWSSYSDYSISTNDNDTDILTVTQSSSDSNNVKISLSEPADITITFNTEQSSSKYPVTITAVMSAVSGSWKYSGDNSDATPEIESGSTNYKFLYNSGNAGNLANNNVTPTKSGNDYWYDFTGKYTAGTNFYVGLANGTTGTSLLGQGNQQYINGTLYAKNNNGYSNVVISDSNGALFTLQLQEHNDVKGSVPFLDIHTIQSRVTAIGIRASCLNNNAVDYKVYYKLSGGGEETASTVDVYAKSGTLRDNNYTMGSYATSKIYKQDGTTEYATTDYLSGQNWNGGTCKSVAVKKGKIITVKTTIADGQRSTYYVKGFDVNGVTYGLIKDESTITSETKTAGVYSAQIEIDAETEEEKIEITPILYKFGEARTRFYIEGYDNVPSTEGWGATLYVYPFYGNLDGPDNSFKAYPGQAVINEGGKRYIDIPDAVGTTPIKGVTLSNGYWDTVHRAIMGWPNDSSSYHKQTYDYDDFYKIKEEVPDGKTLKDIIFYFKYKDGYKGSRTTEQDAGGNTAPATFTDTTTSTWKNDWEPLTDYYGRYVDIFGTPLADQSTVPSASNNAHIHVVSNGYVNNNAGYFGTEWNVYKYSGTEYSRMAQISPSALLMKSDSSFDNYSGTKWSTYKSDYTTLNTNDYKNKPVVITYENALYGGKKPNNDYDRAVRNDGRWYKTYNEDTINANIKIQMTGGDYADWTDDVFINTNEGTATGAKAYFTNTSVMTLTSNTTDISSQVTATDVLQSNTGDFTFTADNSGLSASYKFVGWYRQTATGSVSFITKSSTASSTMSASDTYIARYRYTGAATVKISHTLFPGSALGKTYVSAVVTHEEGASPATTTYSETDGTLSIPMKSDDQQIVVTLKSSSIGENTFEGFYTGTASEDLIASTDTHNVETNKTQTVTILQSDVFNSNDTPKKETFAYYSKFEDVTETINVIYTYTNRFGQTKKYRAERVLDANYLEAYKDTDAGDNKRYGLNTKTIVSDPSTRSGSYTIKEWIMDFAPKVDDLDKSSTWNLNSISTDGEKTFTLTATQENKTHKVKLKFKKNGIDTTSEVLEVADDAFTKTSAYGGLMGYNYNDASSDFKYWAVWSAKRVGGELEKTGDKEYARCYNRFFSLTIPEDSYIEAVYSYDEGETSGDIAAIREPVFTREVSNLDANGEYVMKDGKVVTTDIVYADFVVSYMSENYGVQLNDKDKENDKDKNKYDTGVIMEFNQNVSIDDNIASTITDKKFDSDLDTIKTNLNTFLSSNNGFNGKNYTNYFAPINGTYSSSGKNALYYYKIDNTKYNDFNRLDYFLQFNNTNTWRKRVMKAYYYVKEKSTGEITLSTPVYFAINVIGNSEATVVASE